MVLVKITQEKYCDQWKTGLMHRLFVFSIMNISKKRSKNGRKHGYILSRL